MFTIDGNKTKEHRDSISNGLRKSVAFKKAMNNPELRKERSERMKINNPMKRGLRYRSEKVCEYCKSKYKTLVPGQRWCFSCVPNRKHRTIMRRYRISEPDLNALIKKQKGICKICRKRKAKTIDHDHTTGKVRGLLCHNCNHAITIVENKVELKRAIVYLSRAK